MSSRRRKRAADAALAAKTEITSISDLTGRLPCAQPSRIGPADTRQRAEEEEARMAMREILRPGGPHAVPNG